MSPHDFPVYGGKTVDERLFPIALGGNPRKQEYWIAPSV